MFSILVRPTNAMPASKQSMRVEFIFNGEQFIVVITVAEVLPVRIKRLGFIFVRIADETKICEVLHAAADMLLSSLTHSKRVIPTPLGSTCDSNLPDRSIPKRANGCIMLRLEVVRRVDRHVWVDSLFDEIVDEALELRILRFVAEHASLDEATAAEQQTTNRRASGQDIVAEKSHRR